MLAFDLGRVRAGRGQSGMVDFEPEIFDMVGLGLNRIEVIKGGWYRIQQFNVVDSCFVLPISSWMVNLFIDIQRWRSSSSSLGLQSHFRT